MNALAFVVGNAEYDRPDLHLANVKNDAIAISRNLFGLGFTVDLLLNCNLSTFASRLATFGENLKKYDVGLFYFAGHGLEIKNYNYLVTTDTVCTNATAASNTSLRLDSVISCLEDSNVSTKIIILDACRNNPLPDTLRGMLNGGLAPVYAPTGTIIAFSTSPGQTAMDDGPGGNSIYTHSLISHIADQNIPIETFFKRVRTTVHSLSDGLQTSWEHTCLIGNFCFNEGSLTHAVKMPYPQECLGDKNFVPDGSILSDLIVKMKSHDWYIQKSAIETFKHTKIDSPPHELLFLMGRNILQSAIGTEKVATKFMNSLSYWLPNFQTQATNHVLNGMLFEMYFDKNGRIRSNGSFKSEFIDLIYQLETIEEFSSCFQLIKDQILPFRQIVFYLPGDASVPIDVRLDKFDYLDFQKQEQVKYKLASVKYEGLELKSADPTDRMFFTELSYDELRLKVSRCLMIPLEKLTMTTNFTGSEARFISIPWDLKLSSPKGMQ